MTTDMPMWITDSGLPTDDIETGVAAARALLAERGITAQQAYDASLAQADDRAHDPAHAEAWRDAEVAALNAAGAGRGMLDAG